MSTIHRMEGAAHNAAHELVSTVDKDGKHIFHVFMATDGSLHFVDEPNARIALHMGLRVGDLRQKLDAYIREVAMEWADAAGAADVAERCVRDTLPDLVRARLESGVATKLTREVLDEILRRHVTDAVLDAYAIEVSVSVRRRDA